MGGIDRIATANHRRLVEVCKELCQRWNSHTLVDPETLACSMCCVRLPRRLELFVGEALGETVLSVAHAKAVQDTLFYGFKIEVPIKFFDQLLDSPEGGLFARLSVHLYTPIETSIRSLCEAIESIEHLSVEEFRRFSFSMQ